MDLPSGSVSMLVCLPVRARISENTRFSKRSAHVFSGCGSVTTQNGSVPLLLGARRCRSISPACTALSSKPVARRCWDRRTDRRTPDRYVDPAPHTVRAVSTRCKAKPVASAPGYPPSRTLMKSIVNNWSVNWFACVHRVG